MLIRALVLIVLTGAAFASLAGTATVTWTNPTANTDGSAIPASGAGALVSTRVEWGTCLTATSFGTKAGEVVVNQPATSTVINNLAPGTWCFRAYAKNTYGSESVASNVGSKIVPASVPNPPVIVTIATTAWEIQIHGVHGIRVVDVGNVPLGVECGMQFSGSYYEIQPEQTSRLKGSYRGGVLVARCAEMA